MSGSVVAESSTGKLRGLRLADGGAVFAGIPFAAPPIGARRWQPPRESEPWTGVRDSAAFPAAPAQRGTALMGGGGPEATFASGEDCLYLNVWTPDLAARLPVVVWIYGGGFDMVPPLRR